VVLGVHERKSGGEIGDAARGSSAQIGAVDHIVLLRRHEGATRPNIRRLETLGRFSSPTDHVIELIESGYELLGTVDEVKEQTDKDKILTALPIDAGSALTVEQLVEDTGIGHTKLRELLEELEQAGHVLHTGYGKRGSPFRYFRRNVQSASPDGNSAAAAGPGGAAPAETTGEKCDGHTEQDYTATSEQKAEVRRFVAEILHLWLSELGTPPKVHQAEAFLRDTCGMPGDEGRDVIEQFLGQLWEVVECLDDGGKLATFIVALPKE
jgi:hypothetical protein